MNNHKGKHKSLVFMDSHVKKWLSHSTFVWVSEEKQRLGYVLTKIMSRLGTKVSSDLAQLVKNYDAEYLNAKFDPYSCSTVAEASYNLFSSEVLSKSYGMFPSQDPDRVAAERFIKDERHCLKSTYRLTHCSPNGDVEEILFKSRRKISALFDGRPADSFNCLLSCLNDDGSLTWGPGSTLTIKGRRITNINKLAEYPFRLSTDLFEFFSNYVSSNLGWLKAYIPNIEGPCCLTREHFSFCDTAKVTYVPKNSKVSRAITIEPTMNVAMTKVVGSALRTLLKGNGCDLSDQERNRRLCEIAVQANLATVDLSAASDSVTVALIYNLFPLHIADFLMKFRCPYYTDGTSVKNLMKYAGMGNAITFPLETLVFLVLTQTVSEHLGIDEMSVSVYGDDIICDSSIVEKLIQVFSYCGFTINEKKSHFAANDLFRESCGIQTFNGFDITPIYIKNIGQTAEDCLRNHNRIFRWLVRNLRIDLLPILGSLRSPLFKQVNINPHDYTLCEEDLPLEDEAFFLYRGESNTADAVVPKRAYKRVKSLDFLYFVLMNMDMTNDSRCLSPCVISYHLRRGMTFINKNERKQSVYYDNKSKDHVFVQCRSQ